MSRDSDAQVVFDILTSGEASFVRWFGKHPLAKRHIGGRARTANELERAIAQLNRNGYNGYVHLNPTVDRGAVRTTATDVTSWEFMLIDMDPIKGWESTRLLPSAAIMQLATDVRRNFGIHEDYMAIILTGRGAQLWMRLSPRPLPDDHSRYVVTNASNHFLERVQRLAPLGYKIDLLGDVARIGRLPGTIHRDTMVSAALLSPGTVASPDVSDLILGHYVVPLSSTLEIEDIPSTWTQDWRDVMDEITARAKRFIDYGAPSGQRHADAQHTTKSLWEHGVSRESALEAITLGSQRSQEKLPAKDMRDIVRQVYGKRMV